MKADAVLILLKQYNEVVEDYLSIEAHMESRRVSRQELLHTAKQLDVYVSDDIDETTLEYAILAALREKLWSQVMTVHDLTSSLS